MGGSSDMQPYMVSNTVTNKTDYAETVSCKEIIIQEIMLSILIPYFFWFNEQHTSNGTNEHEEGEE